MEIIKKYFPEITDIQKEKFNQLSEKYAYWNQKINVISRKDMDNFYERHVLYSIAIGKIIQFGKDHHILDVGTGGGFPGVPLAILFPESQFTLLDSIGKKLKVIDEICTDLEIKNVQTIHSRVEDIQNDYDFILSRAVTNLPQFIKITKHLFKKKPNPNEGIYYLKGGDFDEELKNINLNVQIFELKEFFEEDFFNTKKVVQIPFN